MVYTPEQFDEWLAYNAARAKLAGGPATCSPEELANAKEIIADGLSFSPTAVAEQYRRRALALQSASTATATRPTAPQEMSYSEVVARVEAMSKRRNLTEAETAEFFKLCRRAERGW
jgi:hypothetical protein